MQWRNKELEAIENKLNIALSNFKNNGTSLTVLINNGKEILNRINNVVYESTTKLNNSKFPKSYAFSADMKAVAESQKNRGYMLLDKNIELIKSEIKKETKANNFDFVFTLSEAVFASDKPQSEKSQLSKLYRQALDKTGATEAEDTLRQATVLKKQAETIVAGYSGHTDPGIDENDLRSEYISNCERAKTIAGIEYTKSLDPNYAMKPESEKFATENV